MGKRNRFHDHPDPDYQRWGSTYPTFPGVDECVRLILTRKASGAWADILQRELAENAGDHLNEIVEAFKNQPSDAVALQLLMALETAALAESVGFLAEILRHGEARFAPYARRALVAIDTKESRKVLFDAAANSNSRSGKRSV